MQDCTETFLGCMTAAQWGSNLGWAFIGGMFIYLYVFYNGITKNPTTSNKLDILEWLGNPKNWARVLLNTLAILIYLRFRGPVSIAEALTIGLAGEGLIELIVHKFRNPIN